VEVSSKDARLVLGTAGFYKGEAYMRKACEQVTDDADGNENRGDCIVDELLNYVSASFRTGLICCLKEGEIMWDNTAKVFSFISTRNNNFSNRSQKWQIILTDNPDDPSLW